VEVTGITVSKEQQGFAPTYRTGLPVRIELMDYRDPTGHFDKVGSVGMFEHVGLKNYPAYFAAASQAMAPDGLFLLHTIGHYETTCVTDAWIDKCIFPNGRVPSAQQITQALELSFTIEDWHNFGQDYDRTLMS